MDEQRAQDAEAKMTKSVDRGYKTRSRTSSKGKGLLTEKQQANHIKKIILGEIEAGNNHPQLKISLKNINKILKN